MKKLLSILLLIILSLGVCVGFSSCANVVSEKTGFYQQSTLQDAGLSGLSKPDFTYKISSGSTVSGTIKEEEFNRYVQEVFTYLTDKYDYVGVAGERYDGFYGGVCKYKFVECNQNLSSYVKDSGEWGIIYEFIFFKGTPQVGEETTDIVVLEWYPKGKTTSGSYTSWNFQMKLKNFGGLKDTYRYTGEVQYKLLYSDVSYDWGEKDYPLISVVRAQADLEAYSHLYWYNPQFDFANKFIVVITISTGNSAESYTFTSVRKQEGKVVCAMTYSQNGDGACVMGERYFVLEFDNHVQIYSSDDIVVEIV